MKTQNLYKNKGEPLNEKQIPQKYQLVLFAINDHRTYGYEIQEHIKTATKGREKIALGYLYPILQSLEEKEFIKGTWGEENTCGARRRYYEITEKGRSYIKDTLEIQNRLLCGYSMS